MLSVTSAARGIKGWHGASRVKLFLTPLPTLYHSSITFNHCYSSLSCYRALIYLSTTQRHLYFLFSQLTIITIPQSHHIANMPATQAYYAPYHQSSYPIQVPQKPGYYYPPQHTYGRVSASPPEAPDSVTTSRRRHPATMPAAQVITNPHMAPLVLISSTTWAIV
jgi:hypothetical protein